VLIQPCDAFTFSLRQAEEIIVTNILLPLLID
jgi:hypothetical protein